MKGFIVIPDEIFDLGLTANDAIVLAMVHTYSQGNTGCFYGKMDETAERIHVAKKNLIARFKKLTEAGYLVKTPIMIDGVNRVAYRVSYETLPQLRNVTEYGYETLPQRGYETLPPYNNIDNNNIANNIERGKRAARPRDLSEVLAYIQEKGLAMDAEQFYDHFEASGWKMKGGQVIKDWKAAARNWARRETAFSRKQTTTAPDPKRNPIAYNLEQLRIINEKYSKPSPGDPIDEQ